MIVEFNSFVSRLIEACGTAEPAEIARRVNVSYQGAKNYLEGRLPTTEVLIGISTSTGVSIHWLLTGEGPKLSKVESSTTVEDLFDETERAAIQKIATGGRISFEEAVGQLVREALFAKGVGKMPAQVAVREFNMVDADIDARIFSYLEHLPQPTQQAETQRLIGALVTRAAAA